MKFFRTAICILALSANPSLAAMKNWSNQCTITHSNPDNRRDPTFVWDTTATSYGTCTGYDGTAYAFSPCNNAPGSWVTVPLYPQFDDGSPTYSINEAKEIRVTGRAIVSGGTLYLYTRAPGSTWSLSNNATLPWDTGNISMTMPVAQVNGVASIQYKLVVASGSPTYTVNLILDGWCR